MGVVRFAALSPRPYPYGVAALLGEAFYAKPVLDKVQRRAAVDFAGRGVLGSARGSIDDEGREPRTR